MKLDEGVTIHDQHNQRCNAQDEADQKINSELVAVKLSHTESLFGRRCHLTKGIRKSRNVKRGCSHYEGNDPSRTDAPANDAMVHELRVAERAGDCEIKVDGDQS